MCYRCHDTGACILCSGSGFVLQDVCPVCKGCTMCVCVWLCGEELDINTLRTLQMVLGSETFEYISTDNYVKEFVLSLYEKLETIQCIFDTDPVEGYTRLRSGDQLYAYMECGDNILIARTKYHG